MGGIDVETTSRWVGSPYMSLDFPQDQLRRQKQQQRQAEVKRKAAEQLQKDIRTSKKLLRKPSKGNTWGNLKESLGNHTVDGGNPAPAGMYKNLVIMRKTTFPSTVVNAGFLNHQQLVGVLSRFLINGVIQLHYEWPKMRACLATGVAIWVISPFSKKGPEL